MVNPDPFDHYLSAIKRLMESKDIPNFGDIDPDFEPHETNFPKGQGYPNVDKGFEKVAHIDRITASDDEFKKYNKKYTKVVLEYVRKNLPWVFTRSSHYSDRLRETDYVDEVYNTVNDVYNAYNHWINSTEEKLKGGPEWWMDELAKAREMKEKYPTIEEDFKKFVKYMEDFIWDDAPDNIDNMKNYPLFVSLYDVTRNLGGREEGGWWYDNPKLIEAIKVTNPNQVDRIAKMLYNKMLDLEIDGKPLIVLEKEKGGDELKSKPTYG